MSDDFLSRLQAAESDEEREWLALEFNLESQDPAVREAVWAAAIPHWFDAAFLAALLDKPETDVVPIFEKLLSLSFVEVFAGRGYNIHERSRDLLLKRLWEHERDRYYELHRRAAGYCERQNQSDIFWRTEMLYHQVMADDPAASDTFVEQGLEWHNRFDYGKLEALVHPVLSEMRIRPLPQETAANVYYLQACLDRIYARYPSAKDYLELALNQKSDDQIRKANCLYLLGDAHYILNEYKAAKQRLEEALSLCKQIGDQGSEANSLTALGRVYAVSNNYDEARRCHEEALRIYRQLDSTLGEANSLRMLAETNLLLREYEEAQQRFEEALTLYLKLGSKRGEANCIRRLGEMHIDKGEYDTARQQIEKALVLHRKLGDTLGEAHSIISLGDIHYALDEHKAAQQRYSEALEIYRRIRSPLGEANCIKGLADVHFSSDEYELAQQRYSEALIIYQQIGEPSGEAICLDRLEKIRQKMAEG